MAKLAETGGKWGKKIKKVDPLRGGDAVLEKVGLPTATGQGSDNVFNLMTPETPELKEAKAMPTADDDAVNKAKRRRASQLQQSSGRSSTILSDRLGG